MRGRILVSIFIFFTLIIGNIFADKSSPPRSASDLRDKSNIIAIVVVKKGQVSRGLYEVEASILYQFKGRLLSEVSVLHDKNNWSDAPSKLGGEYLVHLNNCEKEKCESLASNLSVIEIGRFDFERPDFLLVMKRLKLTEGDTFKYHGFYWYPIACMGQSESKVCRESLNVMRSSIQEYEDEKT